MQATLTLELIHSSDGYVSQKQASEWHGRAIHLILIPYSILTTLADTLIGSIAFPVVLCTAGKTNCDFMVHHLRSSQEIIALPYVHFLKTLFPKAVVDIKQKSFITSYVQDWMINVLVDSMLKSKNWIKRHAFSRAALLAFPFISLITRVADAAIGIIAIFFSLMHQGRSEYWNNHAYAGLQFGGIIEDFLSAAIAVTNPQA